MVISSGCDPEIPSSILGCGTLLFLLFVLQTNGDAVVDPGPDLGTSYKTNQV